MIVSNTSPLNYLVLIELQHVLPILFGRVLIPDAVLQELRSPAAPQQLRNWLDQGPDWLESQLVSEVPSDLRQLDLGEREAIIWHSQSAPVWCCWTRRRAAMRRAAWAGGGWDARRSRCRRTTRASGSVGCWRTFVGNGRTGSVDAAQLIGNPARDAADPECYGRIERRTLSFSWSTNTTASACRNPSVVIVPALMT